jgi:hypothetical protein
MGFFTLLDIAHDPIHDLHPGYKFPERALKAITLLTPRSTARMGAPNPFASVDSGAGSSSAGSSWAGSSDAGSSSAGSSWAGSSDAGSSSADSSSADSSSADSSGADSSGAGLAKKYNTVGQ